MTCSWFTTVFCTPISSCRSMEFWMLSSLYLSCSVCNCCCVATSCVFTRSICCVGTNSSATWFAFRGAGALRLILSSASLLLILKSGCLNSQAYISLSVPNLTSLKFRNLHHCRTVMCHPPHYYAGLCGSRICLAVERRRRSCYV